MMSLLILNQKVLYLVLLITLLYGLTSANRNITIYVQEDGIDQSECMEGNESIPCHTLSYILNQINNTNNDTFNETNISMYVYITYYQELTNLSHIQLLVNLYLIGVDNPIFVFGRSHYVFRLQGGGCFYAENIIFYEIWVALYSIVTVSFNKCIFTSGNSSLADIEGLYIAYIYNLTISNCLFRNNDAHSELILIDNVFNVVISGSEFYQNKGQIHHIWIGAIGQVHNLTISNCFFHNNDVESNFIEIENVSNVEISGCEFYQNKGQAYLIFFGEAPIQNLNISNCLFRNNDAQSTLIVIDTVFNVEISGSEFYQNKYKFHLILIGLEQVQNLNISNCLFRNNDALLELIVIHNVYNVEISGCEFYQNEDQLLIDFEQVHNLTISNCLFHNNDAQLDLIVIGNVSNVEISGCEFYQNKGQNHLIFSALSYFVDMYNCSIYDNDIKDAIFHWESTNSESMFTITNCLFSNNTSGGKILEIVSDRLYMSNINLISNKIRRIEYSNIRITSALLCHKQNNNITMNISNINFINNTGTGLKLKEVAVYFNNITFYNNTGVYGGGMSLYYTHIYLTGPLIFERNTALFGGAIYIAATEVLVKKHHCTTLEQITFSSNSAGTLGADVFAEDGFSVGYLIYDTFPCINDTIPNLLRGDHIICGAYNITINSQKNSTITLFPGQKLTYSAKVTDYFGHLTSCLVNIILECGNNFCQHVQLNGSAQSLLSTSKFTTNLYLTSNVEHHDYFIKLRFLCMDTNAEVYANVNLTTCPLGYIFQTPQKSQPNQGTCECVDIAGDVVQCDFVLGVACIKHGYWLGNINADNAQEDTLIDTAPCQYPYCKTDLPPCPISTLSQTYTKLPVAQDEQCNGLYGGLLCRSCREDAVFSFEAVNCISSSNCNLMLL